jgi:HprK-related kinase B
MTEFDQVRYRYPATDVLTLSFPGVALSVYTNDPRVASGLARYFAPFRSEVPLRDTLPLFALQGAPSFDPDRLNDVIGRDPGRPIKEAFYDVVGGRIVVNRRTGVVVYIAEPAHAVIGDLVRHLHEAANAVSMVFAKAMLRRGYVMLHASAALGDEGGVAFAAQSGAGKSTMALALVEEGYRFVTNDRLLVRLHNGQVEMVGVPKIPRVNPGTLLRLPRLTSLLPQEDRRRYEHMSPDALWTAEEKRDVEVDQIFGPGTFRLTGRLRIAYILAWRLGEGGWGVRPLDPAARRTVLRRMIKRVGIQDLQPPLPAAQEESLDAIAGAIPISEVTGPPDVSALRAFIVGPRRSQVAFPSDRPGAVCP